MLSLHLPESPTVADLIAVLSRCPPKSKVTDMAYRALTSVDLDQDGDAMLSVLPRVNREPMVTLVPEAQKRLPETMLLDQMREDNLE